MGKPKIYEGMLSEEQVNNGCPFYIGSPTFGYGGKIVPIQNSVHLFTALEAKGPWIRVDNDKSDCNSTLISLHDIGVLHQTYNDKLAFKTEEQARYYSKTGKILGENKMTKRDLKTGMVLEMRDGDKYLLIGQSLISTMGNSEAELAEYSNILLSSEDSDYDIVKIYQIKKGFSKDLGSLLMDTSKDLKLLWERDKEFKEVTMSEVCSKFGTNVKIVKEK